MRFYNFLLFLELLESILVLLYKALLIALYVVIASYVLYLIEFGFSNAKKDNIFYQPELTLTYMYRYIKWWYVNRKTISTHNTFVLVSSFALPYITYATIKRSIILIKNIIKNKINNIINEAKIKATIKEEEMKKEKEEKK